MAQSGPVDPAGQLRGVQTSSALVQLILTVALVANAVLAALLLLLAALVDRQADLLGARSEAHGGFDASVFPPYSDGIWLTANPAAGIAILVLVALIAARIALRRSVRAS